VSDEWKTKMRNLYRYITSQYLKKGHEEYRAKQIAWSVVQKVTKKHGIPITIDDLESAEE